VGISSNFGTCRVGVSSIPTVVSNFHVCFRLFIDTSNFISTFFKHWYGADWSSAKSSDLYSGVNVWISPTTPINLIEVIYEFPLSLQANFGIAPRIRSWPFTSKFFQTHYSLIIAPPDTMCSDILVVLIINKKKNSVALFRKYTIPTERPPLANFCGYRMLHGQCNKFPRSLISVFYTGAATFSFK
jgi:hypothetical protein